METNTTLILVGSQPNTTSFMEVPNYKEPCSIAGMSTFPERVQRVADDVGGQSELARRVSELAMKPVKPGAINNLCRTGSKEARSSSYSPFIAKAGGYRLEWLVSGLGPEKEDREQSLGGYVAIPFYDAPSVSAPLMLSTEWLDSKGLAANNLTMLVLRDESMYPNIPRNSMLLINQAARQLESGKAYLIIWNGAAIMRRAFLQLSGHWSLRYDNPDKILYPDDLISAEEANSLKITGQLVMPLGTT